MVAWHERGSHHCPLGRVEFGNTVQATLWPIGVDTYAQDKDQNSPWPSEQGPCKESKTRAKPAREQSLRNSGELKREDTK